MQETRISLMENFDVEVREKLRDHYERTTIQLNKLERFLWNLSKIEGQREALFDDNSLSLIRDKKKYQLMSKIKKGEDTNNVVHYRLSPPLAEKRVNQAKSREKLFLLPAIEHEEIEVPNSVNNTLQYIKECQVEAV